MDENNNKSEFDDLEISEDDLNDLGLNDETKLDCETVQTNPNTNQNTNNLEFNKGSEEENFDIVFNHKISSILEELSPAVVKTGDSKKELYVDDVLKLAELVGKLEQRVNSLEGALNKTLLITLTLAKKVNKKLK